MEKFKSVDQDMDPNETKKRLDLRESDVLSPFAALSSHGCRRKYDESADAGYRQAFSLDVDRILHSLAYTRYIDKTQVFYLIDNDHITHRVLHVQLLSKIARTIGRFLYLNEDLIEAVALGHDIGHPPFGHEGERLLSDLCSTHGIGYFVHSVQSIQFLDHVERNGIGWNLCLQTLDGILCHDGEIHNQWLRPDSDKTIMVFDGEIINKIKDPDFGLKPMTLEGCVVRMADTISYIGRDLEDAIRLGLAKRGNLPKVSVDLLGNTNGTIVYHLVTDVIKNSYHQPFIALSPDISNALKILKDFNIEHIYRNKKIKKRLKHIRRLYEMLFERFLEDIQTDNQDSVIYTGFLKDKSELYVNNHQPAEIVRDFISGMTDSYFLRQCPEKLRPKPISL